MANVNRTRHSRPSRRVQSAAPAVSKRFHSDVLQLDFPKDVQAATSATNAGASGIRAQLVRVPPGAPYNFEWVGKSHFLAFHDIQMRDGETFADDVPATQRRDARNTFTFIPGGCRVWGWTAPVKRQNSFFALYLDAEELRDGLGVRMARVLSKPSVFFEAPDLLTTVGKLRRALSDEPGVDTLYVESLCTVLAMEFCRRYERQGKDEAPATGRQRLPIERIDEYIRENIGRQIALNDMARVAGLSRFHFLRVFKQQTDETPYQRVLRMRVERATELLTNTDSSVSETAAAVGFNSLSRFIESFRRAAGVTPGSILASRLESRPRPSSRSRRRDS